MSLVAAFAISAAAFGQDTQPKLVKKISIKDVSLQVGASPWRNSPATLAEFQALAPQSVLLNKTFTGLSISDNISSGTNTMFSAAVGIQFRDKEGTGYKKNPQLRLGVTYTSGTLLSGSVYANTQKRYDTLVSAQTGQKMYLDSVTTRFGNMSYTSEQLRLDAALIFRTNPAARWSLYGGLGLTAGMSLNSTTNVYYNKTSRAVTSNENGTTSSITYYPANYNSGTAESFRNKPNFAFSTYIPIGVDFRVGKNNPFWRQVHLFCEFRPSVNMTAIPAFGTLTNTYLQQSLGVRISW